MNDNSSLILKNVEEYIISVSLRKNTALQKLEEATNQLAEKQMRISADQAQFMQFLLKAISAKRVLEIGMFTGYSALAMAQALPDEGYLLTCDLSDRYLSLAKAHWKEAGVENKITVKLGLAIHTLKELIEQKVEKFDFIFIDADKLNYEEYVRLSLQLLNEGGVIALDNTLVFGDHFVPIDDGSPSTSCVRELNEKLFHNTAFDLTMLPIGGGLTLLKKH